VNGRTVYVPALAAIAGLADLSDQSCRWYRGSRPLRAADDNVPAALLPCDSASRASTVGIVRGDDKSDRGVDFAPDHRGVSLGQCTSLSYSGPRHCVWRGLRQRLRAMGIRDKPTAPRSPWQNPYVERLIGTIRRECLDHMVVFGEAHLRRILGRYAAYYNESRIHRSLDKDVPFHRAIERFGVITSQPVLGGLHHQYCRILFSRRTRMPHSIGRLSASAASHHGLSSAAFITNIAESDFRHPQAWPSSIRPTMFASATLSVGAGSSTPNLRWPPVSSRGRISWRSSRARTRRPRGSPAMAPCISCAWIGVTSASCSRLATPCMTMC